MTFVKHHNSESSAESPYFFGTLYGRAARLLLRPALSDVYRLKFSL